MNDALLSKLNELSEKGFDTVSYLMQGYSPEQVVAIGEQYKPPSGFFGGLARGFGSGLASTVSGAARLASVIPGVDKVAIPVAEAIEQNIIEPLAISEESGLGGKVGYILGNIGSFLIPGAVMRAAGIPGATVAAAERIGIPTFIGATTAERTYREQPEEDKSIPRALASGVISGGLTALPVNRLLGKSPENAALLPTIAKESALHSASFPAIMAGMQAGETYGITGDINKAGQAAGEYLSEKALPDVIAGGILGVPGGVHRYLNRPQTNKSNQFTDEFIDQTSDVESAQSTDGFRDQTSDVESAQSTELTDQTQTTPQVTPEEVADAPIQTTSSPLTKPLDLKRSDNIEFLKAWIDDNNSVTVDNLKITTDQLGNYVITDTETNKQIKSNSFEDIQQIIDSVSDKTSVDFGISDLAHGDGLTVANNKLVKYQLPNGNITYVIKSPIDGFNNWVTFNEAEALNVLKEAVKETKSNVNEGGSYYRDDRNLDNVNEFPEYFSDKQAIPIERSSFLTLKDSSTLDLIEKWISQGNTVTIDNRYVMRLDDGGLHIKDIHTGKDVKSADILENGRNLFLDFGLDGMKPGEVTKIVDYTIMREAPSENSPYGKFILFLDDGKSMDFITSNGLLNYLKERIITDNSQFKAIPEYNDTLKETIDTKVSDLIDNNNIDKNNIDNNIDNLNSDVSTSVRTNDVVDSMIEKSDENIGKNINEPTQSDNIQPNTPQETIDIKEFNNTVLGLKLLANTISDIIGSNDKLILINDKPLQVVDGVVTYDGKPLTYSVKKQTKNVTVEDLSNLGTALKQARLSGKRVKLEIKDIQKVDDGLSIKDKAEVNSKDVDVNSDIFDLGNAIDETLYGTPCK